MKDFHAQGNCSLHVPPLRVQDHRLPDRLGHEHHLLSRLQGSHQKVTPGTYKNIWFSNLYICIILCLSKIPIKIAVFQREPRQVHEPRRDGGPDEGPNGKIPLR